MNEINHLESSTLVAKENRSNPKDQCLDLGRKMLTSEATIYSDLKEGNQSSTVHGRENVLTEVVT